MKKREETKVQELSSKVMEFKTIQAQAESVSFIILYADTPGSYQFDFQFKSRYSDFSFFILGIYHISDLVINSLSVLLV